MNRKWPGDENRILKYIQKELYEQIQLKNEIAWHSQEIRELRKNLVEGGTAEGSKTQRAQLLKDPVCYFEKLGLYFED